MSSVPTICQGFGRDVTGGLSIVKRSVKCLQPEAVSFDVKRLNKCTVPEGVVD